MFESILGHKNQLLQLASDIRTENLSQAYLFVGPQEIGKSAVMKSFISQIRENHDFCRKCQTCVAIESEGGEGIWIYRDRGESLKVEEIREMIDKINLKQEKMHSFCVIENIERMTNSAANALLKSLEEPRDGLVFILLSVNLKQVLPTIISRTRILRFSDVGHEILEKYLDREHLDDTQVQNLLTISGGKVGLIMKLIEHPELLEGYMNMYQEIRELMKEENLIKRFSYIEKISGKEEDRHEEQFLRLLAIHLRSNDRVKNARKLEKVDKTKKTMSGTNANKRLLLEELMLNI